MNQLAADPHRAHPSRPLPPGTLPAGVLAAAGALLGDCAASLPRLTGDVPTGTWTVDDDAATAHVLLPLVLAAANGLEPPRPTPAPIAAAGGGWLCFDPGPDDGATLATFLSVLADEHAAGAPALAAEAVARRAQEWRLPVTPFRSGLAPHGAAPDDPTHPTRPAGPPRAAACGAGVADPARPLTGVTVIDLTVMWAAPLATWLLAELGADVVKIEPRCRPDGLRAGPRPAHAGPGDGAHFVALDRGKRHAELDLRVRADHRAFLALVAQADVVIDNFSRRVRPNLGIDTASLAALRPGLIDVSLHAYGAASPEADWVAYGGGVHATSGLAAPRPVPNGMDGTVPQRSGGADQFSADQFSADQFCTAPVAYPDPLAGFALLHTVLLALEARSSGGGPGGAFEVTLAGAAELAAQGAVRAPGTARQGVALAELVQRAAAACEVVDGCLVPRSPLRWQP